MGRGPAGRRADGWGADGDKHLGDREPARRQRLRSLDVQRLLHVGSDMQRRNERHGLREQRLAVRGLYDAEYALQLGDLR
jgi:hypothetical protein